jgi:hypothetical protein
MQNCLMAETVGFLCCEASPQAKWQTLNSFFVKLIVEPVIQMLHIVIYKKCPDKLSIFYKWRRRWDSNPRYAINVHTLSKRAP